MYTTKKYIVAFVFAISLINVPVFAQFDALFNLAKSNTQAASKQIAHFELKGALLEKPTGMPPLFGTDIPPSAE